ncbi:hypothetical protein J4440_06260 [Candidatus Woesearchaeota archaeon]|nr:hypothetical protein [Candidatus Woesearchaeota archaeon]
MINKLSLVSLVSILLINCDSNIVKIDDQLSQQKITAAPIPEPSALYEDRYCVHGDLVGYIEEDGRFYCWSKTGEIKGNSSDPINLDKEFLKRHPGERFEYSPVGITHRYSSKILDN